MDDGEEAAVTVTADVAVEGDATAAASRTAGEAGVALYYFGLFTILLLLTAALRLVRVFPPSFSLFEP